jgi:hypothetical protein
MTFYYSLHETQRLFGTEKVRQWFNEAIDIMPDDDRLDMVGWVNRYFQVKLRDYKEEERKQQILPFAKERNPNVVISEVRA